MKKTLFFAFAAVIFVLLLSCEGPMGPMGAEGPAGRDGQDGENGKDGAGVAWYTTSFTINKDEWKLKGNPGDLNSYFCAYRPLSQLTESVFKYGTVIAYIEVEKGVKNGMPYVLHLGEEANSKEFLWTQTYDFDFVVGEVGFYVTYSDFNTQIRPGTETFHVILMW